MKLAGSKCPYNGIPPEYLYNSMLTGDVAGLRPLRKNEGKGGEKKWDAWTSCRNLFEKERMREILKAKRVIEIGPGTNTDFRDYCIDAEADEYIGVDLFRRPEPTTMMGKTKVTYVKQDGLLYLMDQPDESAIIAGFSFFDDSLLSRFYMGRVGIDPEEIVQATAYHVARVMHRGKSLLSFCMGLEYDRILEALEITRKEFGLVYTK